MTACAAYNQILFLAPEEEDHSDFRSDENLTSQTVVQNLELLTTTLQSYLRSEIAIVCDDIGK